VLLTVYCVVFGGVNPLRSGRELHISGVCVECAPVRGAVRRGGGEGSYVLQSCAWVSYNSGNRGLYSCGFCSGISRCSWWCFWICSCSIASMRLPLFARWTRVIVSCMDPYSCVCCNMCCAYADCGLLERMYLACSE
jgi:hypothetical protein